MNFDSTTYLAYSLKDKLNLSDTKIKNCIYLLKGVAIEFGSIKYDKENDMLTIDATFPDSEIEIEKIIIRKNGEMFINSTLKELIINAEYCYFRPEKHYSIILDDTNNKLSGIYYYNPTVFNSQDGKFHGMYSYYDAKTLKAIEEYCMSTSDQNEITLHDIIGYNSEKIDELGFVPDIEKWDNRETSNEETTDEEKFRNINKDLREFCYIILMKELSDFHQEYSSLNYPVNPLSYKR